MESHPVPKNVLTVEFKLFGALSVRQFLKILGGCIAALALFVLPVPKIITLPLAVVAILAGIGAALIPGFEVRVSALVRSVFVSPRYLWRKKTQVPDALKAKQPASKAANMPKTSAAAEDINLDQLLEARSNATLQKANVIADVSAPPASAPDNFERVYQDAFQNNSMEQSLAARANTPDPIIKTDSLAGGRVTGEPVIMGPNTTAMVKPLQNSAPRAALSAPPAELAKSSLTPETASRELASLQAQLSSISKQMAGTNPDPNLAQAKHIITDKINQLYAYIQSVQPPTPEKSTSDQRSTIFGVVVDKQDKPIPDLEVQILDTKGMIVAKTKTNSADGRFALGGNFPLGEYVVDIISPKHRFYPYKIKLEGNRLPAYKFRER